MRIPTPPLLVITDRHQARWPLADIVAAAFAGGCRWLSVREKDLSGDEQLDLLHSLMPIARRYDACLIVHGEAALAGRAGADGVHLAAGSDAAAARKLLGPRRLVGISIHSVSEARKLDPQMVDYAIAGPAYATPSKPGYGPALGGAALGEIVRAGAVPVVAIGGIDAARAGEACAAGCLGVAVMGGIMRAVDPAAQVRAIVEALRANPAPGTC